MKNDESYLDMSNGSFVYMKKKLVEYSVASEPLNPLQRAIHSER